MILPAGGFPAAHRPAFLFGRPIVHTFPGALQVTDFFLHDLGALTFQPPLQLLQSGDDFAAFVRFLRAKTGGQKQDCTGRLFLLSHLEVIPRSPVANLICRRIRLCFRCHNRMSTTHLTSNEEWKHWGKTDPLYGVLSDPRRRKGTNAPWEDSEFFRVGEEHWRALWPQWTSYGVNTESCLEIGCGAGRMTRQLASVFTRVHAIDVSEGMIATAKAKSSLSNVEYYLTDGLAIPLSAESVTAAFSMHVLQHLGSREVQTEYLRRIHAALRRGGTALIHVPIYKFPFAGVRLRKLYHLLWFRNRLLNRLRRWLLHAGLNISFMEFTEVSLEQVFPELTNIGFRDIQVRIVATHANVQVHPLILATKS